jgi:hypothetical protein
MRIFRSEEHLRAWLQDPSRPRGEKMTIETQWALANVWFEGRDQPGWNKRTPEEATAVLESVGLGGDFWRL